MQKRAKPWKIPPMAPGRILHVHQTVEIPAVPSTACPEKPAVSQTARLKIDGLCCDIFHNLPTKAFTVVTPPVFLVRAGSAAVLGISRRDT